MNIERWIFFGIPFFAGAFAAMFAPDNILDSNIANAIYRTASAIVPAVEQMKGNYDLGQVAKFYYSLLWILSPLMIFGSYFDLQRQRDVVIANSRNKKLLFILFFCVFSLACSLVIFNFTFESNDVNDVRVYMSYHSRWGMALFGWIAPAGASAMIAMAMFGFKNIGHLFD